MYVKLLSVLFLCGILIQNSSGGSVRNPEVDKNLEKMWIQVNKVKQEFQEFQIETNRSLEYPYCQRYMELQQVVIDELDVYYNSVEKEAKKSGVVQYERPNMVALRKLCSLTDEFSQIFQQKLMHDVKCDNETWDKLLDVTKEINKENRDFCTKYSQEIESHADVWDKIENVLFLKFLTKTTPNKQFDEKTDEAIDRVVLMNREHMLKLEQFGNQFNKIYSDYIKKGKKKT